VSSLRSRAGERLEVTNATSRGSTGVTWSAGVRGAAISAAPLLGAARSTTPKHESIVFSPNGPEDRPSEFPPLVQAHLRRNDQCQHRRRVSLERSRAAPAFNVNSMQPKLVHASLHTDISHHRLDRSGRRAGEGLRCRVPVSSRARTGRGTAFRKGGCSGPALLATAIDYGGRVVTVTSQPVERPIFRQGKYEPANFLHHPNLTTSARRCALARPTTRSDCRPAWSG